MQVSEQDMREEIACELADILHRQKAIVHFNRIIDSLTSDTIRDDFQKMAEEDEKNLRMIETAVANFGISVEPKKSSVKITQTLTEIADDDTSELIEKLGAYNLLKQNQVLCSHLVHKSVQVAEKPDIKAALSVFDGIYATFSQHVGALASLSEKVGVEWITGKEPDTGILGRTRDAASTVVGTVLSKTAKPADEMDVIKVLEMDHRKVEALFQEIEAAPDNQQIAPIFRQLKSDLTAHSLAEESVVYRTFRNSPNMAELMKDAQTEHEEIRSLLDEVTDVVGDEENFDEKLDDLKTLVQHHVDEEEKKVFDLMKQNSTEEERIGLSREFLRQKRNIQENVGVDEIIASADQGDTRAPPPSM